MIPWLDVEGRFFGDARRVKSKVFPLKSIKDSTIEKYLQAMETAGLIIRYEHEDYPEQQFLWVPKFHDHQKLRKDREAQSRKPPPPQEVLEQYKRQDRYSRYGICSECGISPCECEES